MIYGSQNGHRIGSALAIATCAALLAACDNPPALGDPNQILVVAPTNLWESVREEVYDALEPRTFTVRDERVFDVAHADPTQAGWENLRVLRQLLLIGSANDPAVAIALDEYDGTPPEAPAVFQLGDLWADNQIVTVALLSTGGNPMADLRMLLPEIGDLYIRQFEQYARSRMFVTGPDESLADSLQREVGFSLVVPEVYRYEEVEPGVFMFRNDQPDPSSLIRNVIVAFRPRGEVDFTAEAALAWREDLAARTTAPPQVTEALPEAQRLQVAGQDAIQVQGVWSNPPGEWPAAGPFITRLVDCGERAYLLDAWLYAPGRSKYEYMFQLNTVLESFDCSAG